MSVNVMSKTYNRVGVFLLLVQLFAPQAVFYNYNDLQDRISISLIGFLWGFNYTSDEGSRFAVNTVSGLGYSFLFLGLGFIFVYQVVQYCKGKAGRTSTLAAGIATMCPILFLMIIPSLLSGFFGGQFPLPVLLAIGLVAIRYAGPKKPITPWDEESNMQIDSP